jgi:hypothetical protein
MGEFIADLTIKNGATSMLKLVIRKCKLAFRCIYFFFFPLFFLFEDVDVAELLFVAVVIIVPVFEVEPVFEFGSDTAKALNCSRIFCCRIRSSSIRGGRDGNL